MGGLDQIFGGSQSEPLLNSQQQRFMTRIYNRVGNEMKDPSFYGGQTIAGVNPMMQGAMAGFPAAAGLNPGVAGALDTQLAGAGDPAGVRAMYEAALGPAQLEFDRTLGQVGARYGDVWGRSGAHPEMVGRATAEYGMGLNNLLANITYQDRQQAADRQAAAIPLAMGVRQSDMDALGAVYGMGAAQRAIEQQGLLGDYNAWQAKQWYNNPAIPLGMSLMGVQTEGQVPQPGIYGQVLGAGQGLANFGLSLMRPI